MVPGVVLLPVVVVMPVIGVLLVLSLRNDGCTRVGVAGYVGDEGGQSRRRDVVRNAAGTVVGMLVPGGGLVSTGAGGSIAIEGRFVAYDTGEALAKFKDREKPKITPVDLGGLTPFQHAKTSIDDWSEQIREIVSHPRGTPVADSSPFTLSPW